VVASYIDRRLNLPLSKQLAL